MMKKCEEISLQAEGRMCGTDSMARRNMEC